MTQITEYIRALNAAEKMIQEKDSDLLSFQLDRIPVVDKHDSTLLGWLVDEFGGQWAWREATDEERKTWEAIKWPTT